MRTFKTLGLHHAFAAGSLLAAAVSSAAFAQSDITPPTIVLLSVTDNILDIAAGETMLEVQYIVDDDLSGLSWIELYLILPSPPGVSSLADMPGYSGILLDQHNLPAGQMNFAGQASFDFAHDFPPTWTLADGQYPIIMRMMDNAGNWTFLPVTAQHPVLTVVNAQGTNSTSACYTASASDRVFHAPFDTVIGPDVISNTPNTGTPPGPNRYLTATTIPGHAGQVLHLNPVPRHETTNYSGRVRFLRDGMPGPSPFGFMDDDFSINFWMRTTNTHAYLLVTRQRNNVGGHRYRGVMVNLHDGQLVFQMNLGEGAQNPGPWFRNWSGGPNIADNQWHMITVTVDRDNPAGGILLVDGAVVATFDPTDFTGNLGNRNFLGLVTGGFTQGNDGDFEFDEIEIYHRVLDTPEIAGRLAAELCP